MTYRLPQPRLVVVALVLLFAKSGIAQSGAQQTSNGSSSSGTASQSRLEAGGGTQGSGLKMVPEDFARLALAPGFLVSLNVLDDSDFVGTFRIDQQGDISVPILGTMHVAGETTAEARVQIRKRLSEDQIIKDPQVSVLVLEYTAPQVTIIGEVASPGKYPLLAPRKLVDVLALAGGTSMTAGNEVLITRVDADTEPLLVHYSRSTNPKVVEDAVVHPGDTVQVKRAGIVYVLGAVNRPGGFVMQEEGTLNVLQAMSLASGTTTLASIGTIYLLRRNADGTGVEIAVPYKKIFQGKHADVQLYAADVLYVPTSKFKSLYTATQSIVNSAATATIYATVVN